MNINRIVLAGGLTRDPDLRYVRDNMAVSNFTVAVEDQKKNSHYIDCVAFGPLAEKVIGKFAAKGKQVVIDGRISQEKWEDKQTGQKRSKLTVIVENFQFQTGSGNKGGNNTASEDDMPI